MDQAQASFREYAIRCKTCNAQIACFAEDYEQSLGTGASVEDSLNAMGITNYCCRIAFMNPTIVMFNMENRPLIEGLTTINAVKGPNNIKIESTNSKFKACRTEKRLQSNFPPPLGGILLPSVTTSSVVAPSVTPSVTVPSVAKPTAVQPLLSVGGPSVFEQGIPLNSVGTVQVEAPKFVEPTIVGVPVINPTNYQAASIYVGNGKRATILTGRTYLAR